ncbi:CidB/LrgB family autolysis modulator [Brevibacillus sp. B_LB10_24]|uniref:CidB/LrgB family autolysis modulator n=1 Tax=Brevibacillus sp. B_LB10_24 TaxID=3380645 RepID=UPI0038B952AF
MMTGLISFILTIVIYYGAKRCYARWPKVYLSPLLVTPVLLVAILTWTHLPYQAYNEGTRPLSYLLQPATVAFAIPLYKYSAVLKKHAVEIAAGVLSGSVAAVFSTALLGGWLHVNPQMIHSLIPHSVTTPIAMGVSERIGGVPTLTAVFVIITGLAGALIGPWLIRLLRIHSEVARGVLLGTSAHGAGTSKAFEISQVAGTISSISMILAALITLCAAPWMASIPIP